MIRSAGVSDPRQPRRLLIVLPGWVGDTVLATPALAAIRRRWPQASIALLGKTHLLELLADGGFADEGIAWGSGSQKPGAGDMLRVASHLRRRAFDTALVLPNSFRSAVQCCMAGIGRRIGYDRDGRGWLLTDGVRPLRANGKFVPVSMVDYYNELARRLDCRQTDRKLRLGTNERDEGTVEALLARRGLSVASPLVVIHAGASFGAAKCWLPERFAEVADRLTDEQAATILLSCGPGEVGIVPAIARMMRRRAHVLNDPPLSIGQLKALIRRSDLLVTNDTGPRHFPIAFGRPVVTIFGSTDPRWTESDHPLERKCLVPVDCGPCMRRVCPLGHHKCMTGVTTEMVVGAARELLALPRRAGASPPPDRGSQRAPDTSLTRQAKLIG